MLDKALRRLRKGPGVVLLLSIGTSAVAVKSSLDEGDPFGPVKYLEHALCD